MFALLGREKAGISSKTFVLTNSTVNDKPLLAIFVFTDVSVNSSRVAVRTVP